MEMCQKKSSLFFGPGWMLNSVCELCAQAEWPWLVKVSAPMVWRYMGYKGHTGQSLAIMTRTNEKAEIAVLSPDIY